VAETGSWLPLIEILFLDTRRQTWPRDDEEERGGAENDVEGAEEDEEGDGGREETGRPLQVHRLDQ